MKIGPRVRVRLAKEQQLTVIGRVERILIIRTLDQRLAVATSIHGNHEEIDIARPVPPPVKHGTIVGAPYGSESVRKQGTAPSCEVESREPGGGFGKVFVNHDARSIMRHNRRCTKPRARRQQVDATIEVNPNELNRQKIDLPRHRHEIAGP